MEDVLFSDLIQINPKVELKKGDVYPFVEMGEVEPGKRYVYGRQLRSFSGGGAKFKTGDILFARITPCLENGKIAQFNSTGKTGFGSTEFFVFRAIHGIADPGYVYYLSMSDIIKQPAIKSMSGASGRQRADLESTTNTQVPYNPLPNQRKIAAILSAYDDLIENNLRRIKILEEMAQLIYREWFVHFRFPGHEKVKMVDSPLGKIPEGWDISKVGELLARVKRKKKIKKQEYETEGLTPIIDQGKELIGGYTNSYEAVYEQPLPVIVFGDHTRIIKYIDFPFACGADGTQLVASNTINMPMTLFYYSLLNINLSNYTYARHFKFFKEQQIIMPEKNIALSFNEIAQSMRNQIALLLKVNCKLLQTRDLLLPILISGELDVSGLDITLPEAVEA